MSPATISSSSEKGGPTATLTGRPLVSGIYVPTVAFFDDKTNSIDVDVIEKHAIRLAKAGVAGLVTHGSNGEAVHLDHRERMLINAATRRALDAIGRQDMPVIVGCGAQSTRETIQLCIEASRSGGSYALVLPPSYYGSLLTPNLIVDYFRDVANESPIPLLVYNFPAACSGLDLNSDVILQLSKHPNIVGVKLTCGNTGKLARIAAGTSERFLTAGGSADFILQTLIVGGDGVIAGLANIAPKACVRIMNLYKTGKVDDAREIQAIVARGDWTAIKGGFVAVKCALQMFYGYGGLPRKPCAIPSEEGLEDIRKGLAELVKLENKLD
ncbi:hypothetical protein OIDMADRAFT_107371 [Oidiodendron maius Zn]|uniref:4-hydroxy-2-oxoglutarate aldolase, mitochondrial n=1 Tax=Oidiodendron maius (strain Zn) TaxID=913774 RepID=A0A0C3I0Z1_OIDMZ|nr:hypothetical protein OIDMADRAFT_107371 [Oidiodendron maius Zn]